jgi:UDP-N-acetylglucosamine--N-acetylmuramyl-(pentapeptide) pyrophosphoryl-undecaprenol N-acetylglucosamine transferase
VLVAAGGTAGHVVPALAVAEALRQRGVEVSFIGGQRAEATLVPQAGFPFRSIAVEGLSRSNPLRAARAALRSAVAVLAARRMIAELAPDVVLGGGGYVAVPVGLAALLARVPLVLSEADSHLGLANRLLARGARRVCLAFPLRDRAGRQLAEKDARYLVTGRPIFPAAAAASAAGARERWLVASGERCVLVFGGSLGARSVNLAAIEGLAPLIEQAGQPGVRVLHICGRRDYAELAGRDLPARYQLIEYLDVEDFGDALAAANLVVARSGGSVFELAAHGLPAILVPYPHAAADHQSANARWMSDAGAALTIPDAQLSPEGLREQVAALLGDGERLAKMAAASASLARPNAAADVADALLEAAER